MLQNDENARNPLSWVDAVLSGLLSLPLIWILTLQGWQSGGLSHIAYALAIYGSPPIVYSSSRILDRSRKRAIGLGILVPFEVVFMGWYLLFGKPFISMESDIALIVLLGGAIYYLLYKKGNEPRIEGQEINI
jgi:hypothetical protein